jgi:hypothetical protein
MQVLKEAAAIDEAYTSGQDITPLCGLPFAVKDNIDVLGYPTAAGTPALEGAKKMRTLASPHTTYPAQQASNFEKHCSFRLLQCVSSALQDKCPAKAQAWYHGSLTRMELFLARLACMSWPKE